MPMHFTNHDYDPMLNHLNILTLSDSRKCQNFLFLYKLFNNYIFSPELISKCRFYVPARNVRNNSLIFFIPHNYTFASLQSISYKLSKLANDNSYWFELNHSSISHIKEEIKRIVPTLNNRLMYR